MTDNGLKNKNFIRKFFLFITTDSVLDDFGVGSYVRMILNWQNKETDDHYYYQ